MTENGGLFDPFYFDRSDGCDLFCVDRIIKVGSVPDTVHNCLIRSVRPDPETLGIIFFVC
jgi:hypothetical protein